MTTTDAEPVAVSPIPPGIELGRVCYLRVRLVGCYLAGVAAGEAVVVIVDRDGKPVENVARFVPLAELIPGKVVEGELK